MNFRTIITSSFLICFFSHVPDASSATKRKKFENPALQFVGTWRVDSYDFREFEAAPDDLENQLKSNAEAFPIGQRIKFAWTGSAGMPGNIDPVTMKFSGPAGETLRMTLLPPFEKKLCDRSHWDYLCDTPKKDHSDELMITEIEKWETHLVERRKTWADIKPIEYTFVHLGKSYNFNVWVAKNGDIVIPLVITGKIKGGGEATNMGIRLKRIKD
ncbi:MAG: hypothetical protein V4724_15785 [Pseudomonadota bacterium]